MGSLMRAKKKVTALAVAGALIITAAVISPAVGGPRFLTLGDAKKVFVTKKQANRKFLRKAAAYNRRQANARFLDQSEGDGRYLPAGTATRIQVSPDNWVAADADVDIDHFSGEVQLGTLSAGAKFFNAALTLPTVLHGRPVKVDSFELCYDATDPEVTLDYAFLFVVPNSTADDPLGSSSGITPIEDDTNRNDATCRTIAGAAPVTLGPNSLAQVAVRVDFVGPGGTLRIGRLTLNTST